MKYFLLLLYTSDKFHTVSNFTFVRIQQTIRHVGALITYNYSLNNLPALGKL